MAIANSCICIVLREIATTGLAPASPGLLQGIFTFKLRRWWQRPESNGTSPSCKEGVLPLDHAAEYQYCIFSQSQPGNKFRAES